MIFARVLAAAVMIMTLAACQYPVQPDPGDNILTVLIETFDSHGGPLIEPIAVRVDAIDGEGVHLFADDGRVLNGWQTEGVTPWHLVLSQAPGVGGGIISVTLRVKAGRGVVVNCRFLKNGIEQLQAGQAGTVCMYTAGF